LKIQRIEAKKPLLRPRKKVAAYARVSMESEKLAHSLSTQVSYYSELIQGNPEWEYAGVYADSFVSGTGTAKRAELQRLIADCEAGMVDIVLTKSISRFARNTVDLLNIVRHLKELGVSVRFEKENIDSLTADGELMLSILAGFAEEESKSISTNIKWSIQKKFERGEQWHTAAFGYRWDGETFIIQEDEAEVVRRIYSDFLADVPIKAIQRWVNENGYPGMSNVGITYMLQNEVYKGDVILQKYFTPNPLDHQSKKNEGELPRYYVENNHAPIIPSDVWQAVQDKIRDAREYNPTVHRIVKPSVFSGKIICGKCGYNYTKGMTRIARADGLKESWVCFGKIKHKKAFCDSLSLRGDRLREAAAKAMGMEEFDDCAFTERVDKIITTEGEALVFRFYDGTEKEVPIKLYSQSHMATDDPHQKFPGYEWTQGGYRVVPDEAEMVRLVYRLYADGMKIEHIRKEVEAAGYASFRGKVSHKFISRMLDDERYSGRRTLAARYSGTGKDEAIENDHDAIIDPELFAKVQELREISWKKQARRLATNKAKREAEHGKNSNSIAADD
jgi:DNA invertase Pin-like site-specific DNA recombinase